MGIHRPSFYQKEPSVVKPSIQMIYKSGVSKGEQGGQNWDAFIICLRKVSWGQLQQFQSKQFSDSKLKKVIGSEEIPILVKGWRKRPQTKMGST